MIRIGTRPLRKIYDPQFNFVLVYQEAKMASASGPSGNDLNGRQPMVKLMFAGPGQYHINVLDDTQRKGLYSMTFEAPERCVTKNYHNYHSCLVQLLQMYRTLCRKIMSTCGMQSKKPSNNQTTEMSVATYRIMDWETDMFYELHFPTPGKYELCLNFNPAKDEKEATKE